MKKPKLRLEVSFNETTGEQVAAYLRVREGKVAETKELIDGVAFADYGDDGSLLGVELLAHCGPDILDQLAENEPDPVRQFLRTGVRRPLAFA